MHREQLQQLLAAVGDDAAVPGDLAPYRIDDPTAIRSLLAELATATELGTVYYEDGRRFLITAVLDLSADGRELYLDQAADREDNRRLLEAGQGLLVGQLQRVRIVMPLERLRRVQLHDGAALAAPLPGFALRLQRRDSYRLGIPMGRRISCRLLSADGRRHQAVITDISVGGVGLIEPPGVDHWALGDTLFGCHFTLPGHGTILSDIVIRSRYPASLLHGENRWRLGCGFLRLEPSMSACIQRYIQSMELMRRAADETGVVPNP